MAGISDYAADAWLNDWFRTTGFTPPASAYIGLLVGDPGRDYLAAEELAATGGYARVAIAKGDASWSAPATSGGMRRITNAAVVDFGTASVGWNGGVAIGYFGVFDAATVGTGNMLGSGVIAVPKIVGSGDPVSFPVGSLYIAV